MIPPEDLIVSQINPHRHGGQHAGVPVVGMTATHGPSGVSVTIPPEAALRSQVKTRTAAVEALEYALLGLGWNLKGEQGT